MNVSSKLDEHQVDLRKKERKKGREEKKGGGKKGRRRKRRRGFSTRSSRCAPRPKYFRNLCTINQHTVYPHKNKNYSYGQYGHAHQILDSGDHYCDLGAPYPNPNPNPNPNPKSNPNPKPNLG